MTSEEVRRKLEEVGYDADAAYALPSDLRELSESSACAFLLRHGARASRERNRTDTNRKDEK